MLNILSKAVYTILTIMTIIITIPGFVTVVSFAVCIIGKTFFGLSPESIESICNLVNAVWHFYGIF